MNPLKMVGGVSIQQAAELLGVPVGKIMQNISSGLLESISFGAGGVDGVTSESVKNLIRLQAEKDLFQRKTIERANKSWEVFERFFIESGGYVRLSRLYGVYEKWTRREGLMTMSKVELGEYLVELLGMKEDWENSYRVVCGISLRSEAIEVETGSPFAQKMLAMLDEKGGVCGGMGEVGGVFGMTGRAFTVAIKEIEKLLEDAGFIVQHLGRTARFKAGIKIEKANAQDL